MTPEQAGKLWKKRRAKLDRVLTQEGNAIGKAALKFTKEYMTSTIYAIPEDRTKKGKKKWRRTGHLRRNEKFEIRETGPQGLIVAIVNTAAYAKARHDYGKPETVEQKAKRIAAGKKERSFNPLRVSHWRDAMMETFQPSVLPEWRQAVQKILREKI